MSKLDRLKREHDTASEAYCEAHDACEKAYIAYKEARDAWDFTWTAYCNERDRDTVKLSDMAGNRQSTYVRFLANKLGYK